MNRTALLFSLTAGILWGFMGYFTNTLSAEFGFSSLQITSFRLIIAAVTFVVAAAAGNRGSFKIKFRDIPLLAIMGISGLMMLSFTYFLSIQHSSMAIAASLMYTAPAIVIIVSRILFKEKFTATKICSLIAAFIGACLVSGLIDKAENATLSGVIFGLLAGIFYASYSIFGTYALKRCNSATVTMWAFIFAAISSLFFADIPDAVSKITTAGYSIKLWLLIVGMGVLTGYLPYKLYTAALEKSEASKVVIVASVEPLVAALAGIFLFGEYLTVYSFTGIILIFISVVLTSKSR